MASSRFFFYRSNSPYFVSPMLVALSFVLPLLVKRPLPGNSSYPESISRCLALIRDDCVRAFLPCCFFLPPHSSPRMHKDFLCQITPFPPVFVIPAPTSLLTFKEIYFTFSIFNAGLSYSVSLSYRSSEESIFFQLSISFLHPHPLR